MQDVFRSIFEQGRQTPLQTSKDFRRSTYRGTPFCRGKIYFSFWYSFLGLVFTLFYHGFAGGATGSFAWCQITLDCSNFAFSSAFSARRDSMQDVFRSIFEQGRQTPLQTSKDFRRSTYRGTPFCRGKIYFSFWYSFLGLVFTFRARPQGRCRR